MKVLTANSYLLDQGWEQPWHVGYGYRADEKKRLHRATLRCGKDPKAPTPTAPLALAGIDKSAVFSSGKTSPSILLLQKS